MIGSSINRSRAPAQESSRSPTPGHPRLLERPFVPSIRMTMAMRRKKTAAMLPKPRPDPFHVRLRHFQGGQRRARKKSKPPLPMRRRQRLQPLPDFEQKHQPMTLSLIPVFADDARQVQIRRPYLQPEFFPGFPARAGMRRL